MAESGNLNLSARIAGGGFDDFFPYELVLEEGFSQIYRAELTVLTKTLRNEKTLRDLLEQKISLTISQRIAGGLQSRVRYLHGIVTGIASPGLVNQGESGCYRHIITIESELARLRWTRLSCPFYRKTPPDIIEEILAKYGIRGKFSSEYVNRSSFSKNLMFDQAGTSDLDFIRHLMNLYGISWTFVQGAAPKGAMGSVELHFTEGRRFPAPFYEYSDKRKIPDSEQFDFINYNEGGNLWKMDSWRMENTIGVDGMELNAVYPETNYGSKEWRWGDSGPGKRYYRQSSLFHSYELRTPPAEIDLDIKKNLEAQRLALTLAKQVWSGGAENILLMPGLVFKLGHFYGSKDKDLLAALVSASHLHVRSLWPRDMASPPVDAETGELVRVEFRAVDWGRDSEKRFFGRS